WWHVQGAGCWLPGQLRFAHFQCLGNTSAHRRTDRCHSTLGVGDHMVQKQLVRKRYAHDNDRSDHESLRKAGREGGMRRGADATTGSCCAGEAGELRFEQMGRSCTLSPDELGGVHEGALLWRL